MPPSSSRIALVKGQPQGWGRAQWPTVLDGDMGPLDRYIRRRQTALVRSVAPVRWQTVVQGERPQRSSRIIARPCPRSPFAACRAAAQPNTSTGPSVVLIGILHRRLHVVAAQA